MMERLTERIGDRIGRRGIVDSPLSAKATISMWINTATYKLAAYEDTGLTPEEVAELKAKEGDK